MLMQASPNLAQMRKGDPDSPAIKYGGMYRRALTHDPSGLDPAFVKDIYSRTVARQIFNGLVQFDAHLKPIPAIAEFWETSRDGLTWTFTLRRGVKFHHGREVTAQDFVYSFTRLLDVNSPGSVKISSIIQGAKDFTEGKAESVKG
jgi:peptide/nickel transport system substrate-binding protein/oligopeptide transport system substrate-binding protein